MGESAEAAATVDVDDSNSFLESELEALQSIYLNELEIKSDVDKKMTCVFINLHPATADKQEEQYVKMTLKFSLNEDYPHTIPKISIHNPRGLSEEKINSTYQDLVSIAENKIGSSMLFEITEAAKEHLTAENRPCGECAICLYGFSESDVFTKTDCYHYFHSHCLARYAKDTAESREGDEKEAAQELLCPMCRVPIQFSGSSESFPPPSGEEEVVVSQEILEVQRQMADLYQKQLEKGGIIDVEAEKNKYLLEISNVPTVLNAPEKPEAEETPAKSEETCPQPQSDNPAVREAVPEDKPKNRPRQQGRSRREWCNDIDDRDHLPSGYPHSRPRDRPRRGNPRYQGRPRRSDENGDSSPSKEVAQQEMDRPYDRRGRGRGNPRYPRANQGRPRRSDENGRESDSSPSKEVAQEEMDSSRPYDRRGRGNPRYANQGRRSHENGRDVSDSSPSKQVPTAQEEMDSSRPYERRGKNRGGPRGYRGRNDHYHFRERRNYNCEGGELSKPRGESSAPAPTSDRKEDPRGPRKGFQARGEYDERRYDNPGSYRRNHRYRGYYHQRGYGRQYQEDNRTTAKPEPEPLPTRKAESDGSKVRGFATNSVLFDCNRVGRPPPGFNDPKKKVVYGPESFSAPPGFPRR